MKKLLTTTITSLLILVALVSHAQTAKLSIQGVLRNANGTAVENGKYDITFRLYTETIPDTLVWEDTMEDVEVEGGVYSVILGTGTKELDAAFDKPYTLGIAIEGGTELIPRAVLTSSPYALSLIGDDNIFPNSGNVGVGAIYPQSKLTVARGGNTLGLDVDSIGSNSAQIISKVEGLAFSSAGEAYYFEGESNEAMRIKKDGKVNIESALGIGTDDPQNPLHIVGANNQVQIDGTSSANISFAKASGTNATIGFTQASGNNLLIDNNTGNIEVNPTSGNTLINSQTQVSQEGETVQLIGATNTQVAFYPQGISNGKKGEIGVRSNGQLTIESANSDVVLKPNGGSKRVYTYGMLHALGYEAHNFSGHVKERLPGNPYAIRPAPESNNISIWANQGVHAPFFIISSDQRIKKDIQLSDNREDLKILSKLEVTDYRHIDEVAKGKEMRKGLIAQQVKRVFPEAIKIKADYIPNIYDFPVAITKKKEQLTIKLSKNHALNTGDKVKILTSTGALECLVTTVISPQEFMIDHWQGSDDKEKLFVYGKEVHDFHTVDYDRIFTLNVSATQALARRVEVLENENAQLRNLKNTTEEEVNALSNRIKILEEFFNTTGSR